MSGVVVGSLLTNESSSTTPISVLYIAVVVLSTFAVGAVTVSTVFQLRGIRVQLRKVDAAADAEARTKENKSGLLAAGLDGSPSSETPQQAHAALLAQSRTDLLRLQRRRTQTGLTVLSLLLNSLPFLALNLTTYIQNDTGSNTGALHASLLVACALVGSKFQELRAYPALQTAITEAEIALLNLRKQDVSADLSGAYRPPHAQESRVDVDS